MSESPLHKATVAGLVAEGCQTRGFMPMVAWADARAEARALKLKAPAMPDRWNGNLKCAMKRRLEVDDTWGHLWKRSYDKIWWDIEEPEQGEEPRDPDAPVFDRREKRSMMPDAFKIDEEAMTITCFEVVLTHPPDMETYRQLFWSLDEACWSLNMQIIRPGEIPERTAVNMIEMAIQ